MSYETTFEGEIEISPPIKWGSIRESLFLPENAGALRGIMGRCIMFRIAETPVETGDGTLIRKEAVALVPSFNNYAGKIVEHLQEVVNTFPDHEFLGRIDAAGEENADMWRLKVVNRVATKFVPELVWPEESE